MNKKKSTKNSSNPNPKLTNKQVQQAINKWKFRTKILTLFVLFFLLIFLLILIYLKK